MKCKVCNCEVGSGIAKCSKCGFPMLQMVQGDSAEEKHMNDLASSFRKKKVEAVRIYMNVYTNVIDGERAKIVKEEEILLAKGEHMSGSQILWYSEKFAQLSGECQLKLNIVRTNGEKTKSSIRLQNPNIDDFWQVGILPLDGMEFQVVLGNQRAYSSSERISYL